MSNFRRSEFDPWIIVSQIGALQASYYLFLSSVLIIADIITGNTISLDQLLLNSEVDGESGFGWSLAILFTIGSIAVCFFLAIYVGRSKSCFDFAFTLHFLHTIICYWYSGSFIHTYFWWMTMLVSLAMSSLGGEYICMQKELEPIEISGQYSAAGRKLHQQEIEMDNLGKVMDMV